MSHKIHKIPGEPFNIATFQVTPHEVDDFFILDEKFQRSVREHSPMIQGIQKTILETRALRSLLHLYRATGDKRYIVVDGKHRLFALSILGTNVRCTMNAVVHRVLGYEDAVRLFEELNKTIPPSIVHFFRLQQDRRHPALTLLENQLPFAVAFTRGANERGHGDPHTRGAPTVNQIIQLLARAFGDLARVSRFTLQDILDGITKYHVELLANFGRIFEEAAGPINRTSAKYDNGWFEVLFKVYIQNEDLQFAADEWKTRIRGMFKDPRIAKHWDTPKVAIRFNDRNPILASLSNYHAPKVLFDPKALPTIDDVRKAADGPKRLARRSGRPSLAKAG